MSKICPRCKKRAKKDLDGFSCITCGWTEYLVNTTPKKVRGSIPYLDKFFISYKGFNPKYRATSAVILTLLYQTKKKLDRVFYFMYCPLDDCNETTLGKRSLQYVMQKRKEKYFKFVCKDKHLWYLVVLNGEPLYWLSNDMEVDMPKGLGTYGKKRGRPPKKRKK